MTPPVSWKDDIDGGKIDGRAAYDILDGLVHVVEDEL
jgi:hypothetical protein